MDASTYAHIIYSKNQRTDLPAVLQSLTTLASLVQEKLRVLQHLPRQQFETLLSDNFELSGVTRDILVLMHEQRDLHTLPRVLVSLKRRLAAHGMTVVEVFMSHDSVDVKAIQQHLGQNTIVIKQIDPSLMSGIVLKTPLGTVEHSVRSALHSIQSALLSPMKG